jgi:tRNA-2-methylthio-N6-dimethylallyladenosine synthase
MTEAAEMDGHLPKEVVQERYERLTALQDSISLERNARDVGRRHEVLVEGPSKKDPSRLSGRTRTNKLVHFPSDGAEPGSIRTVEVTRAHPHFLEGIVTADGGRAPRRSLSLPLVSTGAGCATCA